MNKVPITKYSEFDKSYSTLNNIKSLYIKYNEIQDYMKYDEGIINRDVLLVLNERELLLSKIRFLTKYVTSYEDNIYCINIGSGLNSNHIGLLRIVFPNIKIILFDNEEHTIMLDKNNSQYNNSTDFTTVYLKAISTEGTKNKRITYYDKANNEIKSRTKEEASKNDIIFNNDIMEFIFESDYTFYIYEGHFTFDIADVIFISMDGGKFYLMSDMKADQEGKDAESIYNNILQYMFLIKLKPTASLLTLNNSMIKYTIDEVIAYGSTTDRRIDSILNIIVYDDIKDMKFYNIHFDSEELYLSPYHDPLDLSIMIDLDGNTDYSFYIESDNVIINSLFYHYMVRIFKEFVNGNMNTDIGYDNRWDCSYEQLIYDNYNNKYEKVTEIIKNVFTISIETLNTDKIPSEYFMRGLYNHLLKGDMKPGEYEKAVNSIDIELDTPRTNRLVNLFYDDLNILERKITTKSNYLDIGGDIGDISVEISKRRKLKLTIAEREKRTSTENIKYIDTALGIKGMLQKNSFNLVTAFMSIHHLPNIGEFLIEIYKGLKINGIFYIRDHDATAESIPYIDCVHVPFIVKEAKSVDDIINDSNIHYYSRSTITTVLESIGFEVNFVNTEIFGPQRVYRLIGIKKTETKSKFIVKAKEELSDHRILEKNLKEWINNLDIDKYKKLTDRMAKVDLIYHGGYINGRDIVNISNLDEVSILDSMMNVFEN